MMVLTTEQEGAVLRLLNTMPAGLVPDPDDSRAITALFRNLCARAVTRQEINDSIEGRGKSS